jgi:radical SAM-linked protein
VSGPAPTPEPALSVPATEPRQRWRLVAGRSADAPAETHRDVSGAWTAAIEATGLPLARAGGPGSRPRISFGAPLPVGMAAEGELIDVVLDERWPVWRVREAIEGRLPAGWRLADVYDVWLAGPPLAGRVAAADYRISLAGDVDATALARAADDLLAARSVPRERTKGGGTVAYDLRPLLLGIGVSPASDGSPLVVRTRTRFHPELGTGRPEEVVAALGDRLGAAPMIDTIVRERLLLLEDLPELSPTR